jgi:hypothetical protein
MTIEVFFCEKGDKLVRGVNVTHRKLPNGMVEYTAICPDHPGEVLKKTDIGPSWADPMALIIPSDTPVAMPSYPGTVYEPSSQFWEAYIKSVMAELPNGSKDNGIELIVLAWQNELTMTEKQELLDYFGRTGGIKKLNVKRKNPRTVRRSNPDPQEAPRAFKEAELKQMQVEYAELERKIRSSEVYMMALLNALEEVDYSAAKELDFDLYAVSRIVGYKDYRKDQERRSELFSILEETIGNEGIAKLI